MRSLPRESAVFYEAEGVFVLWLGEELAATIYPREIAELWPEEDLNEIGLYHPIRPEIPEGQQVVDYTVERIEDEVTFVYTLEPIPVSEEPLALRNVAAARLEAIDGELLGIERGFGFAGGWVDGDTAVVYFEVEEPDLDYIVTPPDGVTKYVDHVEVSRPGLSVFSFLIQRVY